MSRGIKQRPKTILKLTGEAAHSINAFRRALAALYELAVHPVAVCSAKSSTIIPEFRKKLLDYVS